MGTTDLILKPVRDLMSLKFSIPDYQRGYRWDDRQVKELLDDIRDFYQTVENKSNVGQFYCLQPIVVIKGKKENTWEVIDGQQRLTTLYIILYCKENIVKDEVSEIFTIEYGTRPGSEDFLRNLKNNVHDTILSNDNVDYYHMSNAYKTILKWFTENDTVKASRFIGSVLKDVQFIWYEVHGEENPREIFSRINLGKIKLTSAELIKALFFLNKNASPEYQAKIGLEWDNIENTLQNPAFWGFIKNSKNVKSVNINTEDGQPNHITLILDLIASNYNIQKYIKGNDIDRKHDEYWSFYVFYDLINNDSLKSESKGLTTKEYLWDLIKSYFRTFDEWFSVNDYFHLTGFLFQMGEKIEDIKDLFDKYGEDQFLKALKERIKKRLNVCENMLEELSYNDNKGKTKISNILLLFNIVSSIESGYIRFPFERYSNEQWSLEHIHAQNSEAFKTEDQRRALLEDQKKYFKNKNNSIETKIKNLLSNNNIDKVPFETLEKEIFNLFTDADTLDNKNLNSIKNLTLLTKEDNSSLSNYLFPVKKDKIKEHDENGHFIPICTKNVFMKYYSTNVEQNVKWDIVDMNEYFKQIKKTLKDYFVKDDDMEEDE
ncbi:MAG: DUF262 domain-containing protein [Termitinemataceae bacterium]|nr:MAG: DUF262 domain-containing protein [Termitinemataceae bacterium]